MDTNHNCGTASWEMGIVVVRLGVFPQSKTSCSSKSRMTPPLTVGTLTARTL